MKFTSFTITVIRNKLSVQMWGSWSVLCKIVTWKLHVQMTCSFYLNNGTCFLEPMKSSHKNHLTQHSLHPGSHLDNRTAYWQHHPLHTVTIEDTLLHKRFNVSTDSYKVRFASSPALLCSNPVLNCKVQPTHQLSSLHSLREHQEDHQKCNLLRISCQPKISWENMRMNKIFRSLFMKNVTYHDFSSM